MSDAIVEPTKAPACPAAAGTCHGWIAEYLDGAEWKEVPVYKGGPNGVPYPIHNGGLLQHIGLLGQEQAYAIAWGYAAQRMTTEFMSVKVRVVQYEIKYQIEARREEPWAT